MRRRTAAAFSLAAALLAGAAFLWLLQGAGRQGRAGGPPQMPPPLVAVSFAALQPIEVTARTTGTVEAAESITVTSPVTGVVQGLRFSEGQQVAKGAPLVELDAKAQLGALAAAQTELKDATRNLRRQQQLIGSGAVSRAALDSARARVDTAQARVNQARGDLSDRRITAPFAGTIGLAQVSVGAVVRPGDPVATLATTGRLKLAFRVPENVLAQLRPGLPVRATVQSFHQPFQGKVTRIDNAVDPATRSIAVEALLDNPAGLRPGLFAGIELVLERRTDVTVPEGSVVLEGEHAYVFTVGQDHIARRQEITLGERRDGMAEVRDGLAPGTRIVTAGVQKVQPDKPVMLPDQLPPRGPAGPPR
jgi:membrane fusion protein (multidrug efflux system)